MMPCFMLYNLNIQEAFLMFISSEYTWYKEEQLGKKLLFYSSNEMTSMHTNALF